MKIRLKPIVHEFNNCFHGQVETIVEDFYHKNFLLTQLWRWTTIMDVVAGDLKVVTKKDNFNTDELDMIGLRQIVVTCKEKKEIIKKIKEEIKNGLPVIVGIQVSNCPWDPNYRKDFRMEHMIIINGFNPNNNSFICCDATYNIQDGELPIREFEDGGSNNYRKIVEVDKRKKLIDKDLEMLLKTKAEELINGHNKHFQRLERIADYIVKNADKWTIIEKHLDNILFSDNYMIIRDCAKTREMLSYVLQKYGKENDRIADLFELSMKKWLKVRIMYVRAATSNNSRNLYCVAEKLREIKSLEEGLVNLIIEENDKTGGYDRNVCKSLLCQNPCSVGKDVEIQEVDLSSYFNNKAFGENDIYENAAFTELGEYMLRPITGVKIPICDGKSYEFCIPEEYDNVICNGQNISVKITDVLEMFIIGTTEYCTGSEKLIFRTENGDEEEMLLEYPEWYTEILANQIPVLKQPVIERESGKVRVTSFTGKLFLSRYKLLHNNISNVILPREGRIHIFKIILLKKDNHIQIA